MIEPHISVASSLLPSRRTPSRVSVLEREPFAPFWPRAVDLVLSRHVSGDAKTDVVSLLKLNESPTVADERAGTNRVALLWRVQMIAATQNLSEIERSMETTLVAAEAIANSPANPALSAAMQYAVDAMSMQMQRLPGDSVIGDAIVLKLKDQIARYRQRARPTFATLANNMDAPVSATGMGELKSQIGRLRVLHEALQKGVTK